MTFTVFTHYIVLITGIYLLCVAGAHILLQRREHQDEEIVGTRRSMAASRSSRVTRSSVGLNGLDENFCGRTLRNRSIAQPEETSVSPLPRARSPKKKQESKQEAKQESKQDAKQESKQDAKHDSQQHGKQESSLQGKVTDSNAFLAEAEHWSSSRKRGVTCLEKDISPEKSDICDGGKGVRDASPHIKRTKRCSRSGECQGHEEDSEPLKPESPESVPEPSKDNSCEEFPSQNSANTAPASPVLNKEEGEVTVAKAEGGHVECEETSLSPNAIKASNGLIDNKAEEVSTLNKEPDANATSVTNCPSLLNGSQMCAPSSPDSAVPCRNSVPGQLEVSGTGESPASAVPTLEVVPDYPVSELIVAKEQEVEVDVVGDPLCLAHEEQVAVSESDANGQPLTPVQEAAASTSSTVFNVNSSPINNSNSGETTPPLATTPSPTEPGCNPSISSTPPSFAELYEHRYTLRTSPRRPATGGKCSSSKSTSPPRDNGPMREEEGVLVGLEEDCPMVEEAASSDSLGPSSEEPVSTDPGDLAGIEVSVPVKSKDTQSSKELTTSQTAEEEEEEDEPDVYYFESDHLALKHNKEYVGRDSALSSICNIVVYILNWLLRCLWSLFIREGAA